jgi:hypothetical protein
MPLARVGRDDRDDRCRVPAGDVGRDRAGGADRTVLDAVPRPVKGPPCLGGRGDAGYLRGWDDAVDWLGQGNRAQPPIWGDVAYMTGWNDASRAIAKARPGASTGPAAPKPCPTR